MGNVAYTDEQRVSTNNPEHMRKESLVRDKIEHTVSCHFRKESIDALMLEEKPHYT